MKKLNLNNQVSDDDEKLLVLLKTSISPEPSEQLVENTLKKILTHNTSPKKVYKPLRLPLYLMFVMGLILLTNVIFSFNFHLTLPKPEFEFINLVENMSLQLDSWYTLSLMLLVLVSMFVVWIELGFVKFRNPFV